MAEKKRGLLEELQEMQSTPAPTAEEIIRSVFSMARSAGVQPSVPATFISHSHLDRDFALYLNQVLRDNGASTFLDQEQLVPGQQLPDELRRGIEQCGVFLLLWSQHSSRSDWVGREWNLAWDRRKKIVPYVLDGTPLPEGLSNLVFIDKGDVDHGHGALLQAVFGTSFRPRPGTMFPGNWHMESQAGPASVSYDFELRTNGQVVGQGRYQTQSGEIGGLFNALYAAGDAATAFAQMARRPFPVRGSWSFDDREQVLTISLQFSVLGQATGETVRIMTSGHKTGDLAGTDMQGRYYRLRRVG